MMTALTELAGDLLSTLVFLVVFKLTGDLTLATAIAVGVAVAQLVSARVRNKPIGLMQWLALGLTLVLAGLSVFMHDSRYIQLKPSIAHFAIGTVMLKRGWQLPYLPDRVKRALPERTLVSWGYAWAAAMFAMGLANIAAASWLSLEAWGLFVGSLVGCKFALLLVQYFALRTAVRALRAQDVGAGSS
jgi:intracellular septation protein A